jgi:hypothetical protein
LFPQRGGKEPRPGAGAGRRALGWRKEEFLVDHPNSIGFAFGPQKHWRYNADRNQDYAANFRLSH